MKRSLILPNIEQFPQTIQPFLTNARLYDSSCSPEASVIFIDKDGGYFLKSASKGTLEREAAMTRYFYAKGLSAKVVEYCSGERDWLVTERIHGEDCLFADYIVQPERLCDTIAERLALLHKTDFSGCPIMNHTKIYLSNAERNYQLGKHDLRFAAYYGYIDIEQAHLDITTKGNLLQTDTLLHGDYCLPNIILNNWQFSGFIDLDNGGVGDRHVDIYWAIWTLQYNLHTDKYRDRFIDCYGRENVDEERLRLCAAIEAMAQ